MKELMLVTMLGILVASWDGWYAKQGTCSRLAKDGGLRALYEWKEKRIDEES